MKTAFIIFDRITALDLIGVYDPLTRLKSRAFCWLFQDAALPGDARSHSTWRLKPSCSDIRG
jgi:hypothetical protein